MPRRPLSEIFGQTEPYVRPIIEGASAALGGIAAGAGATPETLGIGTIPAAAAGGALGYAGGKRLADLIYKRDIPTSVPNAIYKTAGDIGTGATYEAVGAGIPMVGRALYKPATRVLGNVADTAIPKLVKALDAPPSYTSNPYIMYQGVNPPEKPLMSPDLWNQHVGTLYDQYTNGKINREQLKVLTDRLAKLKIAE